VYLRCDSRDVVQAAFDRGFVHAEFVNHNCFLDERLYGFQEKGFEKKYHAALIAKMAAYKRVFLAKEVKDLALIFGDIYKSDIGEGSSIPSHMYKNEKMLSAKEVGEIVQQSYSGLCLSQIEGSCWASNEYLLCGVPVVSTVSRGGRNVWYNPTNSIVCQPNPRSVAESVEFFVKNPPDPLIIRGECIRQTSQFRKTFVVMLQSIFDRFDVKEDASEWFRKNFFHKMENWEEHKVLAEMIRESNKRIKEKQDVGQTAEAAVKVS